MAGTFERERLKFDCRRARSLASLLTLVVIALLLPAICDLAERALAQL